MRIEDVKYETDLKKVEQYNNDYHNGKFAGSEATPISIDIALKVVRLLELGYKWTNETPNGNWQRFDLCPGAHRKYGTNYIYIDDEQKLMRTRQTADEFYNH